MQRIRGPLDADAIRQVRSIARAAEHEDGVAPLSEQPLLRLHDSHDPVLHLLDRDDDGLLHGYAQLDLGAPDAISAELVVHPLSRDRGRGRALLAEAIDASRAIRASEAADARGEADAADQAPSTRPLSVWAHGDRPAARSLARRAGFRVARELLLMSRALDADGLPEPPALPQGARVRPFAVGRDESAWLAVNARAFSSHPEQGRLTLADLHARQAEEWFDPEGFLLVERDGVLLGSVWTKLPRPRPGDPPVGELYVVGVDPLEQGRGLGRALTSLGLRHLAARGGASAILYTEAGNAAAVRTYERAGFRRAALDVAYRPDTQSSPSGATMAS